MCLRLILTLDELMPLPTETKKPAVDRQDASIAYSVEPGANHPLGATPDRDGVNFALFSEHATAVQLLLFAKYDDPQPIQTIPLDPLVNRSFVIWHAYVRRAETRGLLWVPG